MIVEKNLQKVALPLEIEGQKFSIISIIGIGIYPSCGDNFESLMKSVDEVKNRAKVYWKNGHDIPVILIIPEHGDILKFCSADPNWLTSWKRQELTARIT